MEEEIRSSIQHLDRARRIVHSIKYVTIATASANGQPWNSPVYSAFDAEYNFYWASDREGQHSRNIRENPRVFLAIYDSTVPEGTGQGVYIQATAAELINPEEIQHALEQLDGRVGKEPHRPEQFLGAMPRRVYRATPQQVWVNEDGERDSEYIDIRVEIGPLASGEK
jgi:nitroimidazol reductase NimA-like FMN-containing flavoprotein (pyridoxamine 5'-phosphate oxidase superfamily)